MIKRLYHGSYTEIQKPSLQYSKKRIDFGKGFYLTENSYLAKKWACKYRKDNNESFLNAYKLDFSNLNVYEFDLDEEWLNFVVDNRSGKKTSDEYSNYDVLIGTIADDSLYEIIDMYEQGLVSAENALKISNCMDYGLQYALKTTKAMDTIKFEFTKELKGLEKQTLKDAFNNDNMFASKRTDEMLKALNSGKQI